MDKKAETKKIGGWVQKSKETVYDNPWIHVSHEEVVTPGNTDGIYGVVHFKNNGVGIIPIDEEGNTWLVRQSRYTLGEVTWEIPEGGSPVDEDPLVTAQRELQEEVGLKAEEWRQIQIIHNSNSVTDEVSYIFVAKKLTPCEQNLEPSEDIEVKKLPLREAIDMVFKGEITDSISVAGLLRLALM